jgi:hypothetical protein
MIGNIPQMEPKKLFFVIPAQAGIQELFLDPAFVLWSPPMDSRLRGNDESEVCG